jgi:hypothetical protein
MSKLDILTMVAVRRQIILVWESVVTIFCVKMIRDGGQNSTLRINGECTVLEQTFR